MSEIYSKLDKLNNLVTDLVDGDLISLTLISDSLDANQTELSKKRIEISNFIDFLKEAISLTIKSEISDFLKFKEFLSDAIYLFIKNLNTES